jgi:hypothetical protein
MKNFYDPAKLECRTEERVRRIVDLSRRRDRILETPMLDLEALAMLAADYAAAHMPRMAAELRRRLGTYREKGRLVNCGTAGFGKIKANQAG